MTSASERRMQPDELERYLHEHIPISAAMEVGVVEAWPDRVVLAAPLGPNINHRETVFGGSAAALATLAGWSLVHLRLLAAGIEARLVIQRNEIEYERALTGEFTARAVLAHPDAWQGFLRALARHRRARVEVEATLEQDDGTAGHFRGLFVALG